MGGTQLWKAFREKQLIADLFRVFDIGMMVVTRRSCIAIVHLLGQMDIGYTGRETTGCGDSKTL